MKTKLGVVVLTCLCAVGAVSEAHGQDKFYAVVFGVQDGRNHFAQAHSFATFVRVRQQPVQILDEATISWLPTGMVVELRNAPEEGTNFSLKESLELVTPVQSVAQWGPFEIKEDLFVRAKKQDQFLRGGGTLYKAVDFSTRPAGVAVNCEHAISDIVRNPGDPYVQTGIVRGHWGSFLVTGHLRNSMIDPDVVHEWLNGPLGLNAHPIAKKGWNWSDKDQNVTNSIGMKLLWIPPGTLVMGSPKEDKGDDKDEIPQRVTLTKGFYMGATLVTQEQWQAVMGTNPSHFKGEKNLPVEEVSWTDCQDFVKKLGDKEKKTYRLPTQAEWDYSCRAGNKTPKSRPDTISTTHEKKTRPVASFPANSWGLFDMRGNLWQWCQDRYESSAHNEVAVAQPMDNSDEYFLRGGCWHDGPKLQRSVSRHSTPSTSNMYTGFRVCYSRD